LVRTLLQDCRLKALYLVIRGAPGVTPVQRFAKIVEHWDKFVGAPAADALKRVRLIEWDLESGETPVLHPDIDYVIHCAAVTELGVSLAEGRKKNLFATQNLVRAVESQLKIKRFVHFSTAYVSGVTRTKIRDNSTYLWRFHNHYERTKLEAEHFVKRAG